MLAAERVERADDIGAFHGNTVDGSGNALDEVDRYILALIGSFLGRAAELHVSLVNRLAGDILELKSLVRQVPQVLILGVVGLTRNLERDIVCFRIGNLILAALELPNAPGSNDGHFGSEGLDAELKADLIVALAGAAVRDGISALGQRDLRDALRNQRAGKSRAEQVLVFVDGAGLERGEDIVIHKLIGEILDVELRGAGLDGLFLQTFQLALLADIGRDGDYLAVTIVFL